MRSGVNNEFDAVVASGGDAFYAATAAVLGAEGVVGHSLDVAIFGENDDDVFFRMTLNEDRTVPEDWVNYLTLYPNQNYTDEQRVNAAGLSVMDSQEAAENKMRLPWMKKRGFKGLAKISLIPEDGVVLQTSNETNHFTWWRTKMCNLAKAKMV